jgi:predicted esterase
MIGIELLTLYVPITLLFSATSIAYSASLTFSSTRMRPWLRTAGIYGLILGAGIVSVILWNMTFTLESVAVVEKIYPWISLVNSIAPLLYMMNFIEELKSFRNETVNSFPSSTRPMNALLISGCVIAFSSVLIAGHNLWTESYWAIDWKSKEPERAQRLAGPFAARKFLTESGDTVRYRLLKPFDYDSTKPYPVVVCLHGGGAHGTDNVRQIDGAGAAQLLYERRTEYSAFIFVPQCPKGKSWGGFSGYPTMDSHIFESLAALEREFMIDTTRRYIIGASGGGHGTWHFISQRPHMFAAAVPICGGGDSSNAPKLATMAIWAFHGEKDRSVPVNLSRDMVDALRKAGGNPRYTEFTGAGHNIWELVKATPDLLPWMFEQRIK